MTRNAYMPRRKYVPHTLVGFNNIKMHCAIVAHARILRCKAIAPLYGGKVADNQDMYETLRKLSRKIRKIGDNRGN